MKHLAIVLASFAIALNVPTTLHAQQDIMCTMQYDPVCGVLDGKEQTFGNSCTAGAAGATIKYKGECRVGGGSSGSVPGSDGTYTPPANCTAWFDGCNSCSRGPDGMTACTLRACVDEPAPGYCTSYDTPGNTPVLDPDRPVSSGNVGGPIQGSIDIGATVDSEPTQADVAIAAETGEESVVARIWKTISTWFSSIFQ